MLTKKNIKLRLLAINQWIDNALGIDLRRLLKIVYLPYFCKTIIAFVKAGGQIDSVQPVMSQFDGTSAGTARGGYFYQDLVVANHIFLHKPRRHITIGARIDGFVAHVAAFRPIEVMDIRPLRSNVHHNIHFIQQDIMQDVSQWAGCTDSVSCLSTMHHLGMGRYGGQIDPNGHIVGLRNLYKLLENNGTMYIGLSLSDKNRVVFNQSRHFHPMDIMSWAPELDLQLERFDFVGYNGNLYTDVDVNNLPETLIWQGSNEKNGYGYYGIYTFKKVNAC